LLQETDDDPGPSHLDRWCEREKGYYALSYKRVGLISEEGDLGNRLYSVKSRLTQREFGKRRLGQAGEGKAKALLGRGTFLKQVVGEKKPPQEVGRHSWE